MTTKEVLEAFGMHEDGTVTGSQPNQKKAVALATKCALALQLYDEETLVSSPGEPVVE